MTAPELRVGKDQARTARSLGGLLRRYDRAVRFSMRFRRRGDMTGPPERWAWRGILTRILIGNVLVVGFLGAGVLWFATTRDRLIETRIEGLLTQAKMAAGIVAEVAATGDEGPPIDENMARVALAIAIKPSNARAQLFALGGYSILDTRYLLTRNQVTYQDLPPASGPGAWSFDDIVARLYALVPANPFRPSLPLYAEGNDLPAKHFPEVMEVLNGAPYGVYRSANARGEMIVSVAVPVQRVLSMRAVLMLSTEAGDLDAEVWERTQMLWFILAILLAAVAGLSIVMAQTIARPIRSLALAADQVRRGEADETAIPELRNSPDEIRNLAGSFRAMTAALTDRLDTIENFAADVAHEIKNPLTSMRSALETLSRNQDPERAKKLMALLQNDIRRIDRLISDISEASRLDAEMAREKASEIELIGFVQMIVSLYQDQDPPLPVRFDVGYASAEGGLRIRGREGALAQVFRNILDNAISFSPQNGAIQVNIGREGPNAVVTIMDEGPGIPPESLEKVFDRFYTHRPATHGFGKNSGLGLSISKQIVEQHGGAISAANRASAAGAVFTVALPLA
jgi:two-component system, OmpR family, sensor histidine kinase ChvG